MKTITLQRLEVFQAVYQANSISAAARQLQLSQPTVSRHLKNFEYALKFVLFENRKGRVFPTREAHLLMQECYGAFDRIRQIDGAIERIRQGSGERFRVMVAPSLVNGPFIASALDKVRQKQPEIDILLDVGGSRAQYQALRDGRIDIGVAGGIRGESEFRLETIAKSRLLGVARKGFQLPQSGRVPLRVLSDIPCILPSADAPIGGMFHERLGSLGITPLSVATSVSPSVVPDLANALNCFGITDSLTVSYWPMDMMQVVDFREDLSFDVQLIINPSHPDRQAASVFGSSLKKQLKSLQ